MRKVLTAAIFLCCSISALAQGKALDFGPPPITGSNCGVTTPTVAASTLYQLKAWVVPSPTNGHFYKTTTSGTTASGAQPGFNTGSGSTTTWGGAVFTEQGTTNFKQCPDDVSLYVYPNVDGATVIANWSDLENSNGGCTAHLSYDFSSLHTTVNNIINDSNFPAGAKVGIIISGISAGSGPNTHTPCYVFSPTYAASLSTTTMPVAFCSNGQGAPFPGDKPANTNAVFTDGLDTTGYPWTPSIPYSTAWKAFWDQLISDTNAQAYAGRIVYGRIGVFQGGEAFLHCGVTWKTFFSFSTAQLKTAVTNYATALYTHEAAQGATFPLMAGNDGTCVDAVAACLVGYGWADLEAAASVAQFGSTGGFGSQGATETDIAAFAAFGYADGGAASTGGTYCTGNMCYLFHHYPTQGVLEFQTLAASCPQGLNQCAAGSQQSQTGTLTNLLPFWTFIKATHGELYNQDWLCAYDPNFPTSFTTNDCTVARTAYQTAISNFRTGGISPSTAPGGVFGASKINGTGKVQ